MKDMTFSDCSQWCCCTGREMRTWVPNVAISSPMQYSDALAHEDQLKLLRRYGQNVHLILVSICGSFEVACYLQERNEGIEHVL